MSLNSSLRLSWHLFASLLIIVGLSVGCDSGGTKENLDPAPVTVESISVSTQGEVTVEWAAYEAENFKAYAVYRSVPGTEAFERVDVLSSPNNTTVSERLPGFVGGPLRYRIDVRTTDSLTIEGVVTRYDVSVPDASVEVSADGVLTVSWPQCRFENAFEEYSIQRRDYVDGAFWEVESVQEISDTTAIFEAAFGAAADYRVVTRSRIDRRSIAGTPVLQAGMGRPFNPLRRTKYAPARDEIYALNDNSSYVLRLDAESLSRKDSASYMPRLSRQIEYMFRFKEDEAVLEQIDPETFEVLNTYSASSLPGFDQFESFDGRIAVLENGRLAYSTAQGHVNVYDFENDVLVGQTEEGWPAQVNGESFFGNHLLMRKNGYAIYSIEDGVHRLGEITTDRPKFQWLKGPDQKDWFAEYDSGELTIRRPSDFSIVRQFPLDFSLTHLRYDQGSDYFWAVNEYERQLYVFSPESGNVVESIPLAERDAFRYSMTNGKVFYDGGRVLSLDL